MKAKNSESAARRFRADFYLTNELNPLADAGPNCHSAVSDGQWIRMECRADRKRAAQAKYGA